MIDDNNLKPPPNEESYKVRTRSMETEEDKKIMNVKSKLLLRIINIISRVDR